ncbi:type VI secretion system tube protein Hcp [Piscinibacter sp. XHJ-5]|uniref:Hcp family type VI secretion system effector n=1 Tax=Piscinibacter sp. XHJ-5 TaxID=3037797 RepID=UPI0024530E4D|nr:type VI secretion system tube protein Hcp [Piscinibacter sp. XHJ-5]
MPADSYLKLCDISGESVTIDHAGEIDVLSWSWESNVDSDQRMACGLSLTKNVDAASPLILALHVNRLPTEAVLTVERAGPFRFFILRLTLGDVRVESMQVSGSGADGPPMEMIVLSYRRLKMEYQPQGPDGRPLDIIEFGYEFGGSAVHR